VLDRYAGLPGALSNLSTAKTLNGMVKRLLRSAVDAVTDPSGEGGCMISTGMIQCASEHADVASDLADRRRRMHDQIAEVLKSWLDQNDAKSLARYLMAIMQGLSIQARDGASRHDLNQIVDEVVAGLRARKLNKARVQTTPTHATRRVARRSG
jgi:hypothetical protein